VGDWIDFGERKYKKSALNGWRPVLGGGRHVAVAKMSNLTNRLHNRNWSTRGSASWNKKVIKTYVPGSNAPDKDDRFKFAKRKYGI
jgi:hypothetical protein